MKYAASLLMGVFVLAGSVAFGYAQTDAPCVHPREDQVNVVVASTVVQGSNGFTYSYRVQNLADAPQGLFQVATAATNSGGIVTQTTPPNWQAFGQIGDSGYYMWSLLDPTQSVPPGGSGGGFGVVSADLPSIVGFLAWNFTPPMVFARGEARPCAGSSILENSFKGSAVGPKAPPSNDPIQLVNYLISLVHDSRRLNWIKRDGVQQSLVGKLITAKRKLEAGDVATAKSNLTAFVQEVEATSCDDFSCHGNLPATSEAYALLKFNAEYLIARLP